MLNTIEYNTSSSLVDFNAPYDGNTSMIPSNSNQSYAPKQNYIYHQQEHPQQHHQPMIYPSTAQHQAPVQFDSYNSSNQYQSFYNQQHTDITMNPTHNGYMNLEPQMLPSNANSNYNQFGYTKAQENPKKAAYKAGVRGNLASLLTGYDGLAKKELVEDEEFDDEDDDDDDDFDEDDDDFEEEESNDAKNAYSKTNKIKKRDSKKELDTDNDYEIKHNCLTEDGAYMNTLFNSPSSLSSSSNVDMRPKPTHNSLHLMNGVSLLNDGTHGLKTEMGDELHDGRKINSADYTSQPSFSSASSSSSLSNFNEPMKMNNPHMNNMINSYAKAGIMNDHDLVNLPLRELNKRLRALPKQTAYNLKKRRRTLKNRKYAQNCRSKRLEQKSEMEIENSRLNIEINQMRKMIDKIRNENVALKNLMNKNSSSGQPAQQQQQHLHQHQTPSQLDNNQITYMEMYK